VTSRDATREGMPQDLRTVRKDIVRVAATTSATTFAYCPSRGQNECSLFRGEPQVHSFRAQRGSAHHAQSVQSRCARRGRTLVRKYSALDWHRVFLDSRIGRVLLDPSIGRGLHVHVLLATEIRPDRGTFFQSLECVNIFYQIPAPVTAVRPVALQRLSHDMIGQHGDPLSTADLVGTAPMTSSPSH